MQVSVETTTGLGRRMTVQIPADQIDQKVESKLQQLAQTVKLDGFRPGKVPLSVVKKRYEEQVRKEASGELIAATYEDAVRQENLKPVGEPSIEQNIGESGGTFEYTATFEVFPEITLPDIEKFEIEMHNSEVSAGDVEAMLEKLRKQRSTWSNVDRPSADGDRLEIDFSGTIDGESFAGGSANGVPLELGSQSMIPGFEEQLIGLNAGESKTIEVTFPDDYASKEVAGKAAQFAVKVNSVAEPQLPELGDDFAKAFGISEGGMDKLREEVRSNMKRELDASVKVKVKQQVFDQLLEHTKLDIPSSLLDREVDELIKKEGGAADAAGTTRDNYEQEARKRVALGLLTSEILQANNLQVDPAEVKAIIEDLAKSYENPDEVVQYYYGNQEMLAGVQTLVMEDAVVKWVVSQAKKLEKNYTFEELINKV